MSIIIHKYSPILYFFFVKIILNFNPCPNSIYMIRFRKIHNIFLSLLSFIMLSLITYSTYNSNKFISLNSLICKKYDNNFINIFSTELFLYSKYLEWLDTLFLHLSNKKISYLQYYHHMSTAFLVYFNLIDYISPHIFIFQFLNCLVHIPMYWYFAYPNGFLYKYRKNITRIQILQHIICIMTIIYTNTLNNCRQNEYGNFFGLLLYFMYLTFFINFYFKKYYFLLFKKII